MADLVRKKQKLMARSAARQAELAAAALEAFQRDRRREAEVSQDEAPPDGRPGEDLASLDRDRPPPPPSRELPARPTAAFGAGAALRLPHTDWLRHRLVVTGSSAEVEAFREAACGAGTIPWRLDLDSLEEDWFHLLLTPSGRQLSLAGARVLAGQLREAVERRHAIAVSRVGRSRACPFDLHALVPVPAGILHLGPDHPDALAWLWEHWGTTQALRHVAVDELAGKTSPEVKPGEGEGTLRLTFWSADWTPWRALARIGIHWPMLRFDVRPDYAVG